MSLWAKILLGYVWIGAVLLGTNARAWWKAYEEHAARWEYGAFMRVTGVVLGVAFDVAIWPLILWGQMRRRLLAAMYTRFNQDFHAAVVKTASCPHPRQTIVFEVPVPGLPPISNGPMRKCRDCWAIEVRGVWTPNLIPPPPERPH